MSGASTSLIYDLI